jgi:glycosyltransferase involved in cell wall biosynthesis
MNVLFVGRLVDFKDPVTFVKAARLLSEKNEPSYQFVIAGDGVLLKEIKELSSGYKNISVLGWIRPEKVDELMVQADIFCQLSPYENLWASTLISAMKHKRAVICTDAGYTSKYLLHKRHVFLIPPRDHGALAKAIEILAKDNDMRSMLGENAYSFVEDNLSVEKIAGQIRQLLLQSLQSSQSS